MKYIGYAIACALLCFLFGFFNTLDNEARAITNEPIKPEDYIYRVVAHSWKNTFPTGTAFKLKYRNRLVLLTAEHVCEQFQMYKEYEIHIETPEGMNKSNIIATSDEADLCLLELPFVLSRDSRALELSDRNPKLDETIITIGYPGSRSHKYLTRTKYAGEKKIDLETYAFHNKNMSYFDSLILGGQSGSPMLDDRGRVIGMLVFGWFSEMRGGFTNLNNLREFLYKNVQ